MNEFFGHAPQDWERSMMRGMLDGSGSGKAMRDASANPENYTTSRPNMDAEAAFTVGSMRGAGRDGLTRGPSTAYYKIEKPTKAAPVEQTPDPEPEEVAIKKALPIVLSNTAQNAINYIQNSEDLLDTQGSRLIGGGADAAQNFKDGYQNTFTTGLKAQSPTTLAKKQAEIELGDRQAAAIHDNFSLNLRRN